MVSSRNDEVALTEPRIHPVKLELMNRVSEHPFHVGYSFIAYFDGVTYRGVVVNLHYKCDVLHYRCVFTDGDVHDITEDNLRKFRPPTINMELEYIKKMNLEVCKKMKIYSTEMDEWRFGTIASITNKSAGVVSIIFDDSRNDFEQCDLLGLGVHVGFAKEEYSALPQSNNTAHI